MGGIPTDQVLAIVRLKQWATDRAAIKTAKTTHYQRTGWVQRNNRMADARIVRILDFERILARLSAPERIALILTYRDAMPHAEAAALAGYSVRKHH